MTGHLKITFVVDLLLIVVSIIRCDSLLYTVSQCWQLKQLDLWASMYDGTSHEPVTGLCPGSNDLELVWIRQTACWPEVVISVVLK